MSLTTEEIIGGMYRAHQAGQPFAALVANPQFANLPMEQKKEVLAGLRQRMSGETSSTANTLTSIIRGTAGGAMAGVPLGVAVPLALEMSDSGATKKSVLTALKMAAQNKNVKMLVGTGMALGAAGGLLNSVLNLRQARIDHENMKNDLEEASKGGEALAAASFGAIAMPGHARQVNLEPVIKTFRDTAAPYAATSARYGHYAALADANDPDKYNDMVLRAHAKAVAGQPQSIQGLGNIAKELAKSRGHYGALKSIIVNSPRELNIDPDTVQDTLSQIDGLHESNETNIANLSTLEQFARQVRDMKRGVQ